MYKIDPIWFPKLLLGMNTKLNDNLKNKFKINRCEQKKIVVKTEGL